MVLPEASFFRAVGPALLTGLSIGVALLVLGAATAPMG